MLVKSRFRNPDKFIAKLKAELAERREQVRQEAGRFVAAIEPEEITLSFWGECCDDLIPTQKVALLGFITKITKGLENGRRTSTITFTRRSLRSYR